MSEPTSSDIQREIRNLTSALKSKGQPMPVWIRSALVLIVLSVGGFFALQLYEIHASRAKDAVIIEGILETQKANNVARAVAAKIQADQSVAIQQVVGMFNLVAVRLEGVESNMNRVSRDTDDRYRSSDAENQARINSRIHSFIQKTLVAHEDIISLRGEWISEMESALIKQAGQITQVAHYQNIIAEKLGITPPAPLAPLAVTVITQ